MSFRWVKGSPQQFISMGERIKDQLYDSLAESMTEIVTQAAITARAYTAQRGRPTSRGSGRIDTGAMVEAIDFEVVNKAASSVLGRFGFTGAQADYFLYQTVTGFTNWLSGDFIEPTFAIRDARLVAEGEIYIAIKRAIASVHL